MRSSRTILLLISFFFAKFARAQSNELLIQGQTGKLYLEHTVVPKENWYSVGRLYNVSPKELAPYNHTTLAKPLVIGEVLQIPLTATNFSQTGAKTAGETLIPVDYITKAREWMYRISVNHNRVPIPDIEKWNHVTPDQIHPGMHLIVGYLKVKSALSALAAKPTVSEPAVSEPPANQAVTNPPPPPAPATPAPQPAPQTAPQSAPQTAQTTQSTPRFDGGVFKSDFTDGGRSATGQAGVFKSTSGWQDGKYYALMNNATVGTIVRITDPATGKSIYAKILGQLPEMKESAGLTIRISNAAAAELNQGSEGRFNVQINY